MKKYFLIMFAFMVGLVVDIGLAFAEAGKILQSKIHLDFGSLPYRNRINRRSDGWIPRLVGVRMLNAKMPGLPDYIHGHRLLNANGDIDITGTGFKYAIDNLSYIASQVVKQKFYKIPAADFMTVDVGENPWSSEMIRNITFQNGGDFYEGDVSQGQGGQRMATTDVSLGKVRMPNQIWAKMTAWTIFEIAQAAAASKWDIVSDKLESLKTNWDLGIQRTAFLGHKQISTITGLLNNADVNINTSLLGFSLSAMDATKFAAFVSGILNAYFANSNSTESRPNKFVIPTSDYLGLGTLVPGTVGTYPVSKLKYLTDTFKEMCGPDFEILPLAYCQAANNADAGINKARYVLYKDDPEVLKFSIPVDFTLLEAASYNKINWEQDAYGQYSGVLVTRPREMLYLDVTST